MKPCPTKCPCEPVCKCKYKKGPRPKKKPPVVKVCACGAVCTCPDRATCFIPQKRIKGLCVCGAACTCFDPDKCEQAPEGCQCLGQCTCLYKSTCFRGPPEKTLQYGDCVCGPTCPCSYQKDCYRIPLPEPPVPPPPRNAGCICGSACICFDKQECLKRQEKLKGNTCACGSGLAYADCSCYNKDYCKGAPIEPCVCGTVCTCGRRDTCYPQSLMGKCFNCEKSCVCTNNELCQKIKIIKERCVCGLGKDCDCYNRDLCFKVDRPVPPYLSFTDKIGRRPLRIEEILPLKYEKYGPGGAFKTPYSTSVMIKFLNHERSILYRHPFQITANIHELRRDLSIIFKIAMTKIILRSKGQELHPTLIVAELGYKPYDVVELFLDWPENLEPIPDYFAMVIPDIITIRITIGENRHKDVVVEIEDRKIAKPFLGGYSHKETGVQYHHAFTQTGLRASKIPHELQNNRDTQTIWWRHRRQETKYERATQMTSTDTWIPNVTDRIMKFTGYYQTAEEWEQMRDVLGKVRTIQRYFRAWKMRQALHRLHAEYWQRVRNAELDEMERLAADRRRRREEVIRKVYPRSRADYAMLYGMLDRWKKAETDRINQMYTKAPRIAELAILLDREVNILSIIEKHRRDVREDMKNQKDIDFFEEISAPVTWHGYKHAKIDMHTEKVQRGQRYKELYFTMCRRDMAVDQRLQLLVSLKYALKDHNCHLANELSSLLDRECELLVRGLDNNDLELLRKRIQILLREHVKTAQCNSCLTKRYRGVREIKAETDLCFCKRCETLKDYHEFPLHSRMGKPKVCTICTYADITKRPYIDIAPYRFMLEVIVTYERKMNTESCVIYMLNERDIQYVVDKIWHGHSILTDARDLYDLRLVRWDIKEPWAPWNCVLLTEAEAVSHLRVEDVANVYGEHIISDVKNKHLLGRNKFVQMFYVNQFFQDTGELRTIRETETFIPVPSEIFCNELHTEPDYGPPCVKEFAKKSDAIPPKDVAYT